MYPSYASGFDPDGFNPYDPFANYRRRPRNPQSPLVEQMLAAASPGQYGPQGHDFLFRNGDDATVSPIGTVPVGEQQQVSPLLANLIAGNDRTKQNLATMQENLAASREGRLPPLPDLMDDQRLSNPEWEAMQGRAIAARDQAQDRLHPSGHGWITDAETGDTRRRLYSEVDPMRRASALGFNDNGTPYRFMPMPEGQPQSPLMAAMVGPPDQSHLKDGVGGLTVLHPVDDTNRAHDAMLATNAENRQTAREAELAERAGNRHASFARQAEQQQIARSQAAQAAYLASLDPESRASVLRAMAEQQAEAMEGDKDRQNQLAIARLNADTVTRSRQDEAHAKSLENRLNYWATLAQSDDPEDQAAAEELRTQIDAEIAGVPPGQPQASVPSTRRAPSIEQVAQAVQRQRGLSGDTAMTNGADGKFSQKPITPREIVSQLGAGQIDAMTMDDFAEYGLNDENLLSLIGDLEEEAQDENWLGRALSGPSRVGGPFGIGTRDPATVRRAAADLQHANRLLNLYRRLSGR